MKRRLQMQHPTKGMVEIPLGFSWPALLLGPIWSIAKGLGEVTLLLVAALAAIMIVDAYSLPDRSIVLSLVILALYIVYAYACGKYGNAWWRWTLERRGFQPAQEKKEASSPPAQA